MGKRKGRVAWLGVLLILCALLVPAATYAETTAPTRTLDVSGQGTISAPYDTAVVNVGATYVKENPMDAYQAMSDTMNAIVKALHALGIADDSLKTGAFSLSPEYSWTDGQQNLKGYRATNSITVSTQMLDRVAAIIEAAVNAGANQVGGVTFTIKDTQALEDKALDLAVDDARAKADRVAARLGTAITGVQRVNIYENNRPPVVYTAAAAPTDRAGAAPVFTGGGDYTVSIQVTFEMR